jgi:5-hydroxyisourate hydrolase
VTAISTHVLDTARGVPARGVAVALEALEDGGWRTLAAAETDDDGRASALGEAAPGTHRLVFATRAHLGEEAFFPEVSVVFEVRGEPRLHVPLLLAPHGYTTYRGS